MIIGRIVFSVSVYGALETQAHSSQEACPIFIFLTAEIWICIITSDIKEGFLDFMQLEWSINVIRVLLYNIIYIIIATALHIIISRV